jgi:spore coat polysaccharide biosynthesis protein SpsF
VKNYPTIIVQARASSTRYPNKVILPFFNGKSILEIILERIKTNFDVVVATSINPNDNPICELVEKLKIPFYRGSEHNVLDRFIRTADFFNIETIIRVCADNPFLNLDLIQMLIELYNGEDYCSFSFAKNKPTILGHLGVFSEITKLSALKSISEKTQDRFFYEHVTNYLYTNDHVFNIKLHPIDSLLVNYENVRLTVDTKSDFEISQKLFGQFSAIKNIEDLQNMIDFIKLKNVFLDSMKLQINNNSK